MEHTELNNIHDVYSTYRFLLENCQRCSANQKVLSHFAYQIDSYALATLLNFYNTNPDIAVNLLKSQALIKKSYRQKKSIAKQRRQNGTLGRLK